MIRKKSEDAVSPVIGIMLLVVVTVIIAAVITAFATGVVGSTEPAPVAALDVEILNSEEALQGLYGPELFITHRSGDAVDTKDIELRFSWVCGLDDCESGGVHYSTYSADGFKEAHPNGITLNRKQALYVKSTMTPERTEYGSKTTGQLDNYFGDVILTPGLKLTATSDFLSGYENTNSIFMEMVFNNYHNSIREAVEEQPETEKWTGGGPIAGAHIWMECTTCNPRGYTYGNMMDDYSGFIEWNQKYENGETVDSCNDAKNSLICPECNHLRKLCNAGSDLNHDCACYTSTPYTPAIPAYDGIMEHLPAGTAVDVMIVHLPSDKAIYDKTVIVQ